MQRESGYGGEEKDASERRRRIREQDRKDLVRTWMTRVRRTGIRRERR